MFFALEHVIWHRLPAERSQLVADRIENIRGGILKFQAIRNELRLAADPEPIHLNGTWKDDETVPWKNCLNITWSRHLAV